MRSLILPLTLCAAALSGADSSLCKVAQSPAQFHKRSLILNGFAHASFENFTLQDPNCRQQTDIWLDFGGAESHDIVYCCPHPSKKRRTIIEKVQVPLVKNDLLQKFKAALAQNKVDQDGSWQKVRLKGRFFAAPSDRSFAYGHLGCCHLFVIEEDLTAEPAIKPR